MTVLSLTVFLLSFNLLTGCSGCSRSGRKFASVNTGTGLIRDGIDSLTNLETSGNSAAIDTADSIENNNDIHFSIGDDVFGTVYSIIDGDTYDLLTGDKKKIRIRMEGIDAPESGMPF